MFQADRQTDVTKLIVAFRDFANAPKKMNRRRGVLQKYQVVKERHVWLKSLYLLIGYTSSTNNKEARETLFTYEYI
jgi:hypothetical protein